MSFYQLFRKNTLKKKSHRWARRLRGNPQKQGTVLKMRIITPRKPNSARRPAAKISLSSRLKITSHIPGIGHNLRRHSHVLVRGGGARDLPGNYYSCIRGVYDFAGLHKKTRRRSIYGAPRPTFLKTKVRRKFRNL